MTTLNVHVTNARKNWIRRISQLIMTMVLTIVMTLGISPARTPVQAHPEGEHCYDAETGELLDEECEDAKTGEDTGTIEETVVDPVPGEPVDLAVNTFTYSDNMTPLGFSRRTVPTSGAGSSVFNSDLAFWGNYAYHGHYDGFRIIDISDPTNPTQIINYTGCGATQGQGDIVVWENLLVRAWDAPAGSTATCAGQLVGQGFEGLNIFDISEPTAPVLLRNVRMATNTTPQGCGAHTLTLVPDVARGNLYVYVSASSSAAACQGIHIVRIPLDSPADAVFLRLEPSGGRACHDTGVILGDVNLVACAGGNGFSVWSIDPSLDPPAAGSLEDPILLYTRPVSGVSIGHSAAFTFDGEVIVFGHEPGGGSQAQCQASSSTVNKSIYFFEALTGTQLGAFQHQRPQTAQENCTWHNYNIVPTDRGYVFVSGNYQSGISVVDFTNPAAAVEIAYADPAPLSPTSLVLGGDWSTYWYNGRIFEADIRRGLIVWGLDDRRNSGTPTLPYLNPQTQEFSFPLDTTPPTTEVTGVEDGAIYNLGDVPEAGCFSTDTQSGVAQEATLTLVGGTANGVGTFTATCSGAYDWANNFADDATATYQVHYGGLTGFTAPIKPDNTSVFKRGQAVPAKFSFDGAGGFDFSAWTFEKINVVCSTFEEGAVSPASSLNAFRFDADGNQYIFNADFRNENPGSCWRLRVTLDSGQVFTSSVFQIAR